MLSKHCRQVRARSCWYCLCAQHVKHTPSGNCQSDPHDRLLTDASTKCARCGGAWGESIVFASEGVCAVVRVGWMGRGAVVDPLHLTPI